MFTFSQFRPNPTRRLVLIYSEYKSKLSGALSKRIQDELKAAHITALQTEKIIDCPQVPFTVVIKERTLDDGVIELQHHKPKIREEVHVSDLTERIQLQTGITTTPTASTELRGQAAVSLPAEEKLS